MNGLPSEKRLEEIKERNYSNIAGDVQFLLGELRNWELVAKDRYNSWEKSEAENARLREALEEIMENTELYNTTTKKTTYSKPGKIAKSALEGKS